MASTSSIEALVQDVQRQGLSLSALVNNAAVQTPGWSQQEFDEGLATNFAGPLLLAERLLPCIHDGAWSAAELSDSHGPDWCDSGGTIVHVSSGLGQLVQQSKSYRQQVCSHRAAVC